MREHACDPFPNKAKEKPSPERLTRSTLEMNIEYDALLKYKVELTSEISADPLSVSTALVAKGFIPETVHSSVLLQTKEKEVKANELVSQVTNKIRTYPARFDEFLDVLRSFRWLEDVVKSLIAAYNEEKEKKKGSDTSISTEGTRYSNNYLEPPRNLGNLCSHVQYLT